MLTAGDAAIIHVVRVKGCHPRRISWKGHGYLKANEETSLIGWAGKIEKQCIDDEVLIMSSHIAVVGMMGICLLFWGGNCLLFAICSSIVCFKMSSLALAVTHRSCCRLILCFPAEAHTSVPVHGTHVHTVLYDLRLIAIT